MIEAWFKGVGNDRVLLAEQRFEHAAIGVETGGEQDGVVHAQKGGELLLQRQMKVLRAADEPHRGHAEAMAVERGFGGGDQARMIGEAEVIVGAEIEQLDAAAVMAAGAGRGVFRDDDAAALRRGNRPLAFPKAGVADGGEFGGGVIEESARHEGPDA